MADTILALDIATRTGVAEGIPGNTPNIFCIDFGERSSPGEVRHEDVFANAVKWATRVFGEHPPKLLVIEGLVPQYDKTLQCGLWAIISGIATANKVPVRIAAIQSWRLFVLGSGKLRRAEAKTRAIAVCAQLGWSVKNDDEAEAACIWIYACSMMAPKLAPRMPLFMRGAA
jgi:hypothetical protein